MLRPPLVALADRVLDHLSGLGDRPAAEPIRHVHVDDPHGNRRRVGAVANPYSIGTLQFFALATNRERYRTLGSRRLAFVAVSLLLSAWVAVDGGVFDLRNMEICLANNDALHFLCWYVPEFSALWRPFVVSATLTPMEALFGWYCAAIGAWLAAPLFMEMGRRGAVLLNAQIPWRLRALRW